VLPNHPQTLFNQPLVSYSQLLKPFPQYTSVSAFRKPQGNSLYHSFDGPIDQRLNKYFDTSVFSQTGNFTFGNVSRFVGNLRAPGLVNIDFSLFKTFHPVDRVRVQFRAEAYNLANHPTWAAPGTTVNDPANFGRITSASGNRTVQLALKLYF
jgi:hypothetical protein